MTSNMPPSSSNSTGRADGEIDLATAFVVLRRRWWLLLALPLLAGIAAWLHASSQEDTYTAEVLLRKAGSDAVLATWSSPMGSGAEPVRAQFEIIRSRAVLGPVADRMGFRVAVPEDASDVARLFDIDLDRDAPAGRYRIARDENAAVLLGLPAEEVIARAGAGGILAGPGVRVRVPPRAPSSAYPLEFRVLHRESAIRVLRNRLRLDRVPETDLITISFTDEDPEHAANVVSAAAESYQQHSARVAQQEARRRREFLIEELQTTADSIRQAQERTLTYQERSGAVNPELEGQSRVTLLMAAEEDLRSLRYDEVTLAALNEALQQGEPSDEILRRAVVLGSNVLPTAAALYDRLQGLKADRAKLTASRFGQTAEGSQVQVIDSLISNVRNELREIAQHALAGVRQRRQMEEARISDLRAAVSAVPARSGELTRLHQEVAGIQRRYDLLMGKYYEAQIAEAVETGDIEILDPAVVPVIPDPSNTGRTVFLAMFLGLFAATGASFMLAFADRRVHGSADAEQASAADVIAMVPRFVASANGSAGGRPLLSPGRRNASTEAFRSLRTMLRFSAAKGMGAIAVTSAEPGEGKSVVAANLGVTMAADYARVLLIDADFPRPVQHDNFHIAREPGLSDVLVGDAELDRAIYYEEARNLHVLPAGTPVPNSAELLTRPEFRRLMAQVSRDYEVIIVDTPPVLAVADAMAVATVADSMVVVARDNVTDRGALRQATNQIRSVGGNIAGVVLNDVAAPTQYGSYYDNGRNGASPEGASTAVNRLKKLLGVSHR